MVTSALTGHSATDIKTLDLSQKRKLALRHCGANIMSKATGGKVSLADFDVPTL
jgi:hypothetical protein